MVELIHVDAAPSFESIPPAAGRQVSEAIEHLFRHEAGRIVSALTGIFGVEHLTLAEDVVQEALAKAMQTWPYRGVPANPAAWIMRSARNLALDHVRRERNFRDKLPEIVRTLDTDQAPEPSASSENDLGDDRLRMLFVCCHPRIPAESQIALALKVLGGFSPAEIGKAFLTSEAAIAKRLTRARQQLREAGIAFAIPEGVELERRLDVVLRSLYLLFNEGYKASSGDHLVREDVCKEAIRLTDLLARHPAGNHPRTHALLALMLLNTARLAARLSPDGSLLRLADQDRSGWDRGMIARGMFHLVRSATGNAVDEYHLQAGIAACHCAAPDFVATDWRQILSLYDQLMELDDSPVIALNRAVAVAQLHGPQAGKDALVKIAGLRALESYHLLHAAQGEFELLLGEKAVAAAHFQRALDLAELASEKEFLRKRLGLCTGPSTTR